MFIHINSALFLCLPIRHHNTEIFGERYEHYFTFV